MSTKQPHNSTFQVGSRVVAKSGEKGTVTLNPGASLPCSVRVQWDDGVRGWADTRKIKTTC